MIFCNFALVFFQGEEEKTDAVEPAAIDPFKKRRRPQKKKRSPLEDNYPNYLQVCDLLILIGVRYSTISMPYNGLD